MVETLEQIEVEKFKSLIKEMHKGYPNFVFRGMVEKVIPNSFIREHLVENKFFYAGYFINELGHKQEGYSLDINALSLVSSWKIEDLTKWLIRLTITLIIVTIYLIYHTI